MKIELFYKLKKPTREGEFYQGWMEGISSKESNLNELERSLRGKVIHHLYQGGVGCIDPYTLSYAVSGVDDLVKSLVVELPDTISNTYRVLNCSRSRLDTVHIAAGAFNPSKSDTITLRNLLTERYEGDLDVERCKAIILSYKPTHVMLSVSGSRRLMLETALLREGVYLTASLMDYIPGKRREHGEYKHLKWISPPLSAATVNHPIVFKRGNEDV